MAVATFDAPTHAPPTFEALQGLWTRSSIQWPDGRADTTTRVFWLQGSYFFADLRQPAGAPDFTHVRRLEDLDDVQMAWLASQEGFAGELQFDGDCFEWRRVVDFQPKAAHPDRGRLHMEQGVLVEHGVSVPYIEHWHRAPGAGQGCAAWLIDEAQGRNGFLVRYGNVFMYARGSAVGLPKFASLSGCLRAAPSREAMYGMLDFEISLGRATSTGWKIERSSLPFRIGERLQPRWCAGGTLTVWDYDLERGSSERQWTLHAFGGRAEHILADSHSALPR